MNVITKKQQLKRTGDDCASAPETHASSRHVSKVDPQSSAAMKDSRERLDKNREHLRHAPGRSKRARNASMRASPLSCDDVGNAAGRTTKENNDDYSYACGGSSRVTQASRKERRKAI